MRAAIPSILLLLVLTPACGALASDYLCTADGDAAPTLRLETDRRGGSMGNPSQRSAFLLREIGTGRVLMRCPRGFRSDRIRCTGAGMPAGRFLLDRDRAAYALVIGREGAVQARREAGHCTTGGGAAPETDASRDPARSS